MTNLYNFNEIVSQEMIEERWDKRHMKSPTGEIEFSTSSPLGHGCFNKLI